ncbi:hypothetical protein A2U01_0090303, partial [Trifolium medium]|nr:hypothetical protein [Trifolium medium]
QPSLRPAQEAETNPAVSNRSAPSAAPSAPSAGGRTRNKRAQSSNDDF